MKSQETKKGSSLLKSIITLIVTLLLGTTAWSGIQEDASNDGNYNSSTNQTISTESNNNLNDDVANNTLNDIQSNLSESNSSNDNQETSQPNSSNDNQETSESNNSNDNQVSSENTNETNNSQKDSDEKTEDTSSEEQRSYTFRSKKLLDSHYEKHGKEMGFSSAKEYEKAASKVVTNEDALHKIEEEDGDDVYYIESTNEFVVVSKDGYLRTYFYPSDGLDYFNRQ